MGVRATQKRNEVAVAAHLLLASQCDSAIAAAVHAVSGVNMPKRHVIEAFIGFAFIRQPAELDRGKASGRLIDTSIIQ